VTRSRRFTFEDQKRFAALSGDTNPIHLDSMAARRTQAGTVVVHGMHMLLWSLDTIAASTPSISAPKEIRADFLSFLPIDMEATLGEPGDSSERWVTLSAAGAPIMRLELRDASIARAEPHLQNEPARVWAPTEPCPMKFSEMHEHSGAVAFACTAERFRV
jgi:hypothetical protein